MRTATAVALLAAFASTALAGEPLTAAERAAGWKSLSEPTAWRGYKQQLFPAKGWTVEDGALKTTSGGGDIITLDQYGDFELELDWKAAPKANSGIMFRVTEKHDATYQTGPEFQVFDDAGHGLKPDDMHSAGALYDLAAPSAEKKLNPAGEWNHARLVLHNGLLRQYINGVKVVECRTDDQSWKDRIAKSKFKDTEGFGVQPKGHIALQDHGDTLWFRDIKVRDLDAMAEGEVALFNGKGLTGWKAIVPDAEKAGVKPESVWEVKDGILICKGNPVGYIRTEKDYTNYVLKVEWRFNPVTKQAGNSGVLLRMVGEDKVWPKSVEAQLQSGSAGDFWNIDEFKMKTDPSRLNGRNTKKTHGNENPIGEWNEYEIIVDHGTVTLKVNGEVLNEATDVEEVAGKICLQSEGAEIHFRKISVIELQ